MLMVNRKMCIEQLNQVMSDARKGYRISLTLYRTLLKNPIKNRKAIKEALEAAKYNETRYQVAEALLSNR